MCNMVGYVSSCSDVAEGEPWLDGKNEQTASYGVGLTQGVGHFPFGVADRGDDVGVVWCPLHMNGEVGGDERRHGAAAPMESR